MTATQVYRVYIKTTPQQIWDAITRPEWTQRYGYSNIADFDLRPGGQYKAYPSEAVKRTASRSPTSSSTVRFSRWTRPSVS
jgi:uncharacterized protein YndB with AHSA1/START domain